MKRVKNDLTGQRFGRLTVVGIDDRGTRQTYYNCVCDCGITKSIRGDGLKSGAVRSCGCLKREQNSKNLDRTTHGMSHTRLHDIWLGMKGRCYNPHDARYSRYGGRGIEVCREWQNDFGAFCEWAFNNGYSDNLTIDRINNDGNYSPENCRWATTEEQSKNRSTNIKITIGNATKTLSEWCAIFELDYQVIRDRYKRNGFKGVDDLFSR